ncbi:MAG: hypothetical protein ACI8P3_002920 [Saprospiraceae bacterium]|jgi:hypothetical protein
MAQDIRQLFEQERKRSTPDLFEGHEDRFFKKLDKQFPQKKQRRLMSIWLQVAAASLLFIGIGWGGYYALKHSQTTVIENPAIVDNSPPLDISPIQEDGSPEDKPSSKMNVSPGASKEKPLLTLSDISPDLKKVETYFISSIYVELANLEVVEEEQEMVDAYLIKIKDLGKEYEHLNQELNTIGVNDMTITALIENLKIRLQLLQRLKKSLNHSKKENHEKNAPGNI